MTMIRLQEGEEITISEARVILMELPQTLTKRNEAIPLTHDGEPVMALMAWGLFETIREALEILTDEELVDVGFSRLLNARLSHLRRL